MGGGTGAIRPAVPYRRKDSIRTGTATPVVFIHGLWLHGDSWAPWQELFEAAGHPTVAPGWPGVAGTVELARAAPESIADRGIDEVVEHYAAVIDEQSEPPILIGHSFGGMIAQKLLGQNRGAAAIAIDAAQIKGVLPLPLSALRLTFPVFANPANKHRAVSLTAEQFRFAFGNAVSPEESDELYERWTIPAPGRPCSRPPRPTSRPTHGRRSTRSTRTAGRCC
ncbi:esterase/lipase family protein [Streptomyces sp. CA-142005]|uniref:esterase/lipase family protein n=1 Tax=Streptomyces sp. CA-142005 TaxID=3240052 RepID=UPI003D8AEFEA